MKHTLVTAALIGGLAASLNTYAGELFNKPVQVSGRTATGSPKDAAKSADNYTRIGCSVSNALSSSSSTVILSCSAYDIDRNPLSCYKLNPPASLVASVAGINRLSFIHFTAPPSGGECTGINITNDSRYW